MNRRAKRRRTTVNYAKLASGGFDDDAQEDEEEEEEEEEVLRTGGRKVLERVSEGEEEEEVEEAVKEPAAEDTPSVRRRRRKPRGGRSAVLVKLPTAVLELNRELPRKERKEKERREKEKEREREKPKKKRVVTSDDSEEDEEEFGYDNDQSEDFVPRKVRGKKGFVEDDDHVLDEEDEELEEAEMEALEEAKNASGKKNGLPSFKGHVPGKPSALLLDRGPSSGRNGPAVPPRPSPRLLVSPSLNRSLSGGRSDSRTLPSPSTTLVKGAQGRLLKKIGVKTPVVTAITPKAMTGGITPETLRQKSLSKGGGLLGKQDGIMGKSSSGTLRPWYSTPGSGKWDRKSTEILDDETLFSQARAQSGSSSGLGPAVQSAVEAADAVALLAAGMPEAMQPRASAGDGEDSKAKGAIGDEGGSVAAVQGGEGIQGTASKVSDDVEGEDGELVEGREAMKGQIAREVEALVGSSTPTAFGNVFDSTMEQQKQAV